MNKEFLELVSYLLHSATQVHVFHLQTNSYAEHKALNEYYDEIVDLTDGLIESYQGQYDILKGYKNYELNDYQNNAQVIKYFKALMKTVEDLRKSVEDNSHLQNEIDNVVNLITSTLYKLRFLK
jgi:hypothetical protein